MDAGSLSAGSLGTGSLGTGSLGTGSLGTGSLGTGSLGTGSLGTGSLGTLPTRHGATGRDGSIRGVPGGPSRLGQRGSPAGGERSGPERPPPDRSSEPSGPAVLRLPPGGNGSGGPPLKSRPSQAGRSPALAGARRWFQSTGGLRRSGGPRSPEPGQRRGPSSLGRGLLLSQGREPLPSPGAWLPAGREPLPSPGPSLPTGRGLLLSPGPWLPAGREPLPSPGPWLSHGHWLPAGRWLSAGLACQVMPPSRSARPRRRSAPPAWSAGRRSLLAAAPSRCRPDPRGRSRTSPPWPFSGLRERLKRSKSRKRTLPTPCFDALVTCSVPVSLAPAIPGSSAVPAPYGLRPITRPCKRPGPAYDEIAETVTSRDQISRRALSLCPSGNPIDSGRRPPCSPARLPPCCCWVPYLPCSRPGYGCTA